MRHARGDETYLAFNGEFEHPMPNEIIFADAPNQVHARRWTFRQSRRSTIRPQTAHVLVVSEGLHEDATEQIRELTGALSRDVTTLWKAPTQSAIPSADSPRLDIRL